jgi:hypothetical protein
MNKPGFFLVVAGVLWSSDALCSSNPQSYLDGNPQTTTDAQLYPVRVAAVDGDMQFENPVRVYPGPRWLEIQLAPGSERSARLQSKSQTFVMKIEPCTRYYLGAHKDSALADKWKLVVDKTETVQSCDPAEELKKAEANPPRGGKVRPPHS